MADDSSSAESELRSSDESSSEESSEDEFEESQAKSTGNRKKEREVKNMPFDEALDVSASMDHSVAEPNVSKKGGDVKNMPFDEALDVSASMSVAEPGSRDDKDNSIKNKPFDEAMDIESDSSESIDTQPSPRPGGGGQPKPNQAAGGGAKPVQAAKAQSSDEEESSSEEESEDAKSSSATAAPAGAYKPEDMEHLQVSAEIRELFQYIQRYKPHTVELDHKLKCFIPDYVPSVGQIDAFLKVPRPDGQHNDLGLKLLDEPASVQSDPTVLDLQMRAISKRQHGEAAVRSIENASKDPKAVQKWIDSIVDLHRSKPLPQVNYTKNMPEIEPLMQVWPEEFEELLKEINLPGVDMDLSLTEYVKLICAIMDIPVYGNVVESLHVLFTLFSEFKSNQHFMNMGGAGEAEAKAFDPEYDFGGPAAAGGFAEAKGGDAKGF
jgi:intraflagellar transport protein 46